MTTLNPEALSTDNAPTDDTAPDAADPDTSATVSDENPTSATEVDANAEHGEDEDKPSSNSEAAKYRIQLRAAETALTEANTRIESYQKADVLRAAKALAQPSDLLDVGGHDLTAFLHADGTIDTDAVTEKVAELLQLRPGLAKGARIPAGPKYPNFGQGAPATSGHGRPTTWANALNPHRA
ncbi:hypothetical protein FEZ60_30910 [Rhodococcus sp. MS16]|uniref:hypothetical protein n=1 Tax=Rhodococcus sp. MS16 TaxID=2579941 RepID=UPI001562918F|nr:hypothetical protein [Rhodococcus sp. MS16]NRI69921.1 hypothetical protein [Rhodococcus sp. MS16]